jgi:hypothetical protein
MSLIRKHSGPLVCLILSIAVVIAGCPPRPQTPSRPTGGLRIRVMPEHARIYVDERLAGDGETYADRPLLLEPGEHRIKVVAEGHYAEYVQVHVGEDVQPLEVELIAVPEPLEVEIE